MESLLPAPPPITKSDVPLDHWASVHSMAFGEICQFLNSIGIRQLMSNDPATLQARDPHLWKLFGCMYNAFGICNPSNRWEKIANTGMVFEVNTRPAILSPFQAYHLEHFPKQVLVFSGDASSFSEWAFQVVYHAIHNFAVDKHVTSFTLLTPPLCTIITEYLNLPTRLNCCTYDNLKQAVHEKKRQKIS